MTNLSADTFTFLSELTGYRDQQWFAANRSRYEAHLLEPMRSLVLSIGPRLKQQIPDLECRPQVNKSLMRINRDMRFARRQNPYKDHMLAVFYREGRKKEDPQFFVGVQPTEAWVGLYLSPVFLGAGSPMAKAVADCPSEVVAFGKSVGIGKDIKLGSCSRYGLIEKSLSGEAAGDYLVGPHLCAMRTFTSAEVAEDPINFVEVAAGILGRVVPLWKTYLEGL